MNPTLSAPIHAATAMLTATVTAMSMIDATTGLRALLLRLNLFIFSFIPPFFGINVYGRGHNQNLNLTTHYTILSMCKTNLHKKEKHGQNNMYANVEKETAMSERRCARYA
jgi:hypothetical protein